MKRVSLAVGLAIDFASVALFVVGRVLTVCDGMERLPTVPVRVRRWYVTHDQVEAMTLGERVAVLKDGVLQQVARPMELYKRPANQFVAGFIGSPAMNFIEGTVRRDGDECVFASPSLTLPVPCPPTDGDRVVLGVRPEHITLGPPVADGDGMVRGAVALIEPIGGEQIVHVTLADGAGLVATAPPDAPVAVDESVSLHIALDRVQLFSARDGKRLAEA